MKLRNILVLLLVLLIISTSIFIYLFHFFTEKHLYNSHTQIVDINKGEGVKQIAAKLKNKGVISNDRIFVMYVLTKKVQGKLKAGEYIFKRNITIAEVVNKLKDGDVRLRKITIPEGLTLNDIANLFDNEGLFSKSSILSVFRDDAFRNKLLGNNIKSFEGFLFPETYIYLKNITPQKIIKIMVEKNKEVFKKLKENKVSNKTYNLNDYELLKLASIIEKESEADFERSLISSVFHNRLRIGMKLDSDPTVIYGLGEQFDGNLRRSDLDNFTEYNTYMKLGLPPTPISNPGEASIKAALNPEDTSYFYFFSKGDGTHYYSKTYKEHQRAVYKYQIKKSRD